MQPDGSYEYPVRLHAARDARCLTFPRGPIVRERGIQLGRHANA
jgi:hypothetical protein